MINVNALGDACPIPVVKTKKAIQELNGAGEVCVLVDNEIAVQNLTKMAQQKGYAVKSEKLEEKKYQVVLTVGEVVAEEGATLTMELCDQIQDTGVGYIYIATEERKVKCGGKKTPSKAPSESKA